MSVLPESSSRFLLRVCEQGSGETALMRRLALAFVVRLRYKQYHSIVFILYYIGHSIVFPRALANLDQRIYPLKARPRVQPLTACLKINEIIDYLQGLYKRS